MTILIETVHVGKNKYEFYSNGGVTTNGVESTMVNPWYMENDQPRDLLILAWLAIRSGDAETKATCSPILTTILNKHHFRITNPTMVNASTIWNRWQDMLNENRDIHGCSGSVHSEYHAYCLVCGRDYCDTCSNSNGGCPKCGSVPAYVLTPNKILQAQLEFLKESWHEPVMRMLLEQLEYDYRNGCISDPEWYRHPINDRNNWGISPEELSSLLKMYFINKV